MNVRTRSGVFFCKEVLLLQNQWYRDSHRLAWEWALPCYRHLTPVACNITHLRNLTTQETRGLGKRDEEGISESIANMSAFIKIKVQRQCSETTRSTNRIIHKVNCVCLCSDWFVCSTDIEDLLLYTLDTGLTVLCKQGVLSCLQEAQSQPRSIMVSPQGFFTLWVSLWLLKAGRKDVLLLRCSLP